MKKDLRTLMMFALAIFIGGAVNAQKLPKFGGDLGKKVVMGKDVRVPYMSVVSYLDYVKPGIEPDEVNEGKKFFYVYIWVPIAAPEIGVRMISPVPEKFKTKKVEFITQAYLDNENDKSSYFDTWISFERAGGILSVDNILEKAPTANWTRFDSNDDSGEMPAQPSGSKYNSLMRISSDINNPLKAIVIGLYRIGFTTYKRGEVQGSFLAQIGAPIKIPGIVIAKDLESLVKMVKENKEK